MHHVIDGHSSGERADCADVMIDRVRVTDGPGSAAGFTCQYVLAY